MLQAGGFGGWKVGGGGWRDKRWECDESRLDSVRPTQAEDPFWLDRRKCNKYSHRTKSPAQPLGSPRESGKIPSENRMSQQSNSSQALPTTPRFLTNQALDTKRLFVELY